ncbi:T6SS effector BTH_I2691 family protein [Massilia suwonensis]|uniref:T6SS effector BTH_I2691 family protein n=1 Tax=Massilia suwonensis TaxID=648895 RepID=A0ABW0MH10_9BURK
MICTKKCEFCDKRGLPLLLVRDAVAPAGADAPRVPALPIELSSRAAHYTKRLLRSGYVNVFDEARRRWDTYFVTPDGYLFKLMQQSGAMPITPKKPFDCPDEGHRAVASCITVSDPVNATKIWVGFSDVLWTDAVRTTNEDAAYRKRHMTEIDIKAALSGRQTPHQSIKQVDAQIAEYAMAPSQAKANFEWSPFEFTPRQGQAERLKRECDVLRADRGLIVTLTDPVGIAQELAFLMKRNALLFSEKNVENKRYLAASNAIDRIEEVVRKQVEDAEMATAEQIADQQIQENPLGHLFSASTRAQSERIRDVTPTELKHASDNGWNKYAQKFDNAARRRWEESFSRRLQAFDAEFIAPLALSHVAWMKSIFLINHLDCNYDPHNAESGVVFTKTVTQCIVATQDKKACTDLYEDWLQGDIADSKNILLRAMILNQNITKDAIKSATTVGFDLRQLPWDTVFTASTLAIGTISSQAQDVTAHLITQIGSSIAKIFHKVIDGNSGFRAAVMATGLISGHPIVVCDLVGTKKQFVTLLTKQLIQLSGQPANEEQLRRAVAIELKRQKVHGKQMSGTTKRSWLMIADKEFVSQLPDGLTPQQRHDYLAKSIKTTEAVEALNLGRWRKVISTDVRAGVVTGILQAVCLTKLISDEAKSLKDEKFDASARLYSGMVAVAATTSEVVGHALAGRVNLGMRFGHGFSSKLADFLKHGGKGVGLCAGLVVAGLDVYKAYKEYQEGSSGLIVVSYIGSAIVGVALSAAILLSVSIPIIGLLVLLAIGIGILIENIKDNPVQDWLERCPWGKLANQRYLDFDTEQAQLKLALS